MGTRTTQIVEAPISGPSRGGPSVRPAYNVDPVTGERSLTTQFGNIQYTPVSAERPQEVSDLLTRYKTISEQGYSAPEYAARKAQAAAAMKAQGQEAQRQLLAQQARQGVRGGAAVAQQQRAAQQIAAQRAAIEQAAAIEDYKNRQAMMGQYGGLLGGAISREDKLALENLKRDIAAQVTGIGAGAFGAQMGLAEKAQDIGSTQFQDYLDFLKEYSLTQELNKKNEGLTVSTPRVTVGGSGGGLGGGFGGGLFGGSGPTYGGDY
jgi:hypothetical protein